MKNKTLLIPALTGVFLLLAGCYWGRTTDISGVPSQATAWKPLILKAEVSSISFVIKPKVLWSIKNAGTTNARIVDEIYLHALSPGTLVVTANVENYINMWDDFSKDFTITVFPAPEEIDALGTELISHNVNTNNNPVSFKINLNLEVHWENIKDMLIVADRYVDLDLTGSTGTQIPPLSNYDGIYLNNNKVLSVILPDSITSIGTHAFSHYKGLTNISMGNNVAAIGERAFFDCIGLSSINIPDSVTNIGDYAFYGCIGLGSIYIPDSVTNIGNHTFNSCSGLTSITIHDSVTSIGDSAFRGCSGLTSITIPDSVTSIGDSAFRECTGLTSVSIGNNVASIGSYAFNGCRNITSITIPNSVTSIGNSVFDGCSLLTAIDVEPGNTMYSSIDGVLYNETASVLIRYPIGKTLGDTNIPGSVTVIANGAFRNCRNLTGIILPESVTHIGNFAFNECISLTSIIIPDSVINIGDSAFRRCTVLDSVSIGNNVAIIEGSAFSECLGLISVTIPASVTSIGRYAFSECLYLTSVTFEGTLTETGFDDLAFPGYLRFRYFANSGGPGTYTRQIDSDRWSKD